MLKQINKMSEIMKEMAESLLRNPAQSPIFLGGTCCSY